VATCGGDRDNPPYRSARSSLPGRALVPRSQFGVQMKPAVERSAAVVVVVCARVCALCVAP
jgi:hypothetical protein